MRLTYLLSAALLLGGCADVGFEGDSFQDDDPPIGECPGTECPDASDGFGDDGASVGEPCDNTIGCAGTAVCAAEFQDGEAGVLTCQASCINEMDESMWCSDDDACCGNATCSPRGFCIGTEGLDESGDDDSTGGSTSMGDGASTGDDDGTATGSGSTGATDSGTTTGGSGETGTETGA